MSLRVAILGAGIGREHLAGYLALGDRFRVSHVCDLNLTLAQELAGPAGAQAVADIDAVLGDPDVDIVDICLPPSLHAEIADRALRSGKHVICEKPIAGSPEQASAVQAVAETSGKRLFPVFQYRFGRAFYAMDALKREGLAGRPRVGALETHWNRGRDYYANPWRGTWAYEMGGAVLSHAIHIHDLAQMAFGPVSEVSARLDTLVNPIETEDCAAILLRMKTDALVTSSVTLGGADDASRLRFVFEHVTAESQSSPYAPGQADWTFLARDPSRQKDVDAVVRGAGVGRPEGFAGLFDAIAHDLERGTSTAPTVGDGVASIHLAAAIYRSSRNGQAVKLPLERRFPEFSGLAPSED